jgi:hypothetical protein
MRPHTPRFVTLASAAVLLVGCAEGHPLAPSASAEARAGTTLAAPSSAVAVGVSESRIDVQWKDNSSNETRFEILRSTSGASGQFVLRATTDVNAVAYNDVGLEQGTQYCYSIRAVRTTGIKTDYSPSSNIACTSTKPIVVTPAPPSPASRAVAVPSGSSSVTVSWFGAYRVGDWFRLERSSDGGVVWQVVVTLPSGEWYSFTDGPLPSERPVCYRVVAYNATAASEPSNTTCTTPPAAPTEATVRQVDATGLELTWSDNSAVEDGYEVLISTTDCSQDGWGTYTCWTYEQPVGALPAGSTRFRLPTWANPYTYGPIWVRAMKDGGYSDSAVVENVTTP